MSAIAARGLTHEEFFALCDRTEGKLEYVGGRVVAMARGSFRHARLVSRFGRLLGNAAGGGSCESFTETLCVEIPLTDSLRIPDVLVACPPNVVDERNGVIDNPTVVVAVLSPGTRASDLSDKLKEYASIPSLRHYVLVDSERMAVQTVSRTEVGDWRLGFLSAPEDLIRIAEIGFELALADLYDGVAFDGSDAEAG